ncbi:MULTISPECIES: adenosylmethionine--8-amino-7-oxononanoate transaminase [unclassified Nocardioides]|uniref:adenosylmethionine--8-amino-7-oxononanoate transaminase n=1 Tax=unclassified Nocardioides TaxID=2615069 RepID=UPI001152FDC6|nr:MULTISPECIES: adenosylmethionine--8-amino-7-oxononanoate transaminase [unclassified Nocardioides]TQK72142.1 adenosylmethionine-8-amino-7-oxononanoate aminotransferase [Nocardioides sp. SLBN-35]WGY03641.1 adenosylmethionine--8-amino-7-oxononanoate transaminase [Nocardioides sp. QY071]
MTVSEAVDLLAFDREHLWHPYTSMTEPTPVRLVTAARGCELEVDGRWVVDAMSSWWSAIHGYRHPVLDAAVAEQAGRFSHVMFGGLTHEPAVELGRRLVEITPEPLERVFLADSGSVSVEVAMKMVLQYQRGAGRTDHPSGRTRMLTVLGGYHGDTFDCMSVTDPVGGMHSLWAGLLPEQVFAPRPPSYDAAPAAIAHWADAVRDLAARHARELAGIIVEPLLQGAGGMWPYPVECLRVLREVADEHGLLLVFDEIATGFGRTGHLFVSELVTPDVLCLGKALTGGYLTLAAVLTTDAVARGISGSEAGVVMHGPTFMGNPLACAVASASIDLLLSSDWAATVTAIGERLTTGLAPLRSLPGVVDVRTIGAVGVVQLDHPVDVVAATDAALAAGVWLRPFRDLVYAMPPYVAGPDAIDRIVSGIAEAVKAG